MTGVPMLMAAILLGALAGVAGAGDGDAYEVIDLPAPRSGWLFVLPVVTYAPETGVAFGASAAYQKHYATRPGARPSTALPVLLLTGKRQLIASLLADAWFDDDRWHLVAVATYRRYPTQFYGIGDDTPAAAEETYTDISATLQLELTRRLAGPVFGGMLVDAGHTRLRKLDPAGQLQSLVVPGSRGGDLHGLGLVVAWDSRDAVQYPTRGWYQRLAVTRYVDVLGGDYRYTWTEAGVARYVSLGERTVLAAELAGSFQTDGEVPFYRLNRLDLRGYFEERHRQRHVVRAQMELRTVVWRGLGAVVFAGLGELADRTDRLRLDEARPMLGGGLRLNVGGEQRANLALDLGFGDGDSGFYVRFAEAF